MRLISNDLREEYLKTDVRYAITLLDKARGLMFTKSSDFNYTLVFDMERSSRYMNSIHMLFVFYPILAIFLNEEKIVVDKAILKPFTPIYIPKKECRYIVETQRKYDSKIAIGNKLDFNA